MTNMQRVQQVYPDAICVLHWPIYYHSKIWYVCEPSGGILSPCCSLPKYAWQYAWKVVQREMIKKLEN